jgi:glycoside/pentoside/hexuronide:cation symporter, GPH family
MGVLSCGRYMYQVGAIHVARYSFYIGGSLTGKTGVEVAKALQSNISKVNLVFAVATAVGMFTTMLLIPRLIKKFNYKQIVIASCLIGFAASVFIYIIGYQNFWACVPFLVLACVPAGAINVLSSAMIGDALDYMEWKTGRRENGLGSACQSFVNKLGSALATTFVSLMYKLIDLNSDKISLAYTQGPEALPDSVRGGMFLIVSIIPGVMLLLCGIPLLFYDLVGKKRQMITDELQMQRELKGISVE